MFARTAVVALSALTSLVSAANFTIDPNSVSLSQRATWCTAETNSCTQICTDTSANSCDPSALTYSCTCSDGTTPDMTQYTQTLPYFICQQAYSVCISTNAGSATGQANCTKNIQDQCGTKAATAGASSSTSTTTTAASGTKTTSTGSATAATTSTASTSTSKAGAMPTSFQYIGNGAAVVAAGIFAALI